MDSSILNEMASDAAELPAWLFVAAECGIRPPIDTRLQELPLHELTWQNFEKLCYRLARGEADVRTCRLYGEAGDKQEGIDLFAKRAGQDFVRLLAKAAPSDSEFREWVNREIKADVILLKSQFGYDLGSMQLENLFSVLSEV